MFVAERGGRIVGFVSIRDDALLALYVDPESGRGTGKPLLLMAEDNRRRWGVERISMNESINAVQYYMRE